MLIFYQLWIISMLFGSLTYGEIINLIRHLQPEDTDDLDNIKWDDPGRKLCTRKCTKGSEPLTCYYRFVMENYAILTAACGDCPNNITECYNPQCIFANGHERSVLSVNRRLPGPSIQVCLGDRVVVDVTNNMLGQQTSVHWHGIYLYGQNYMDGADMFTQCPIVEGNTFRYDFWAKNAGTFFWHSHDGYQKQDGVIGNLVVRQPPSDDPNSHLYDEDLPRHVVMIQDWALTGSSERYPGLQHNQQINGIDSLLIGGRGRRIKNGSEETKTPYKEYKVTPGKRYRFRFVGGICERCPVRVRVERHKLLIIAVDAQPVNPIDVDAFTVLPGNRVDVVIRASEEPRSYLMQFQALGPCYLNKIQQLALLQYDASSIPEPIEVPELLPENPNIKVFNRYEECGQGICYYHLKGLTPVDKRLMELETDIKLILNYTMNQYNNPRELFGSGKYINFMQGIDQQLTTSINHISSTLTENNGQVCRKYPNGTSYCEGDMCHCLHVIPIPLGASVQLIIVDASPAANTNHPFHIHGYSFVVLTGGNFTGGKTIQDVEEEVKFVLKKKDWIPPGTDTVPIEHGGYVVVRFIADNPGKWLLHCHILKHQHTGMLLLLKIGEEADFPKPPKDFPHCENFTPPVVGTTL